MEHALKGALSFRYTRFYVHNPIGRGMILCNSACTGLGLSELNLHYQYSVNLYGKGFSSAYYSSLSIIDFSFNSHDTNNNSVLLAREPSAI